MKKIILALYVICVFALVGCSNSTPSSTNPVATNDDVMDTTVDEVANKEEKQPETVDKTQEIISAINEALDELSLTNNYSSIIAKKDKSLITVYIKTSDYIWDNVQKNSSLKNSYKADFSTIYNKALETAKSVETNNIPTIGILVQEPDGSNLAAVSGTSNVTFLFE